MAIQTINIGNVVNDGLGDDLRTAFQKVNANFADLKSAIIVTASNATNAGQGLVAEGSNTDLKFKTLLAGNKINLEGFSESIRINSTAPDAFTRIDTDVGFIPASTHQNITIQGTSNINVTAAGQVITIDTDRDIETILSTLDFGFIGTNYNNTVQFAIANLNVDFGTITAPGDFYVDLGEL